MNILADIKLAEKLVEAYVKSSAFKNQISHVLELALQAEPAGSAAALAIQALQSELKKLNP